MLGIERPRYIKGPDQPPPSAAAPPDDDRIDRHSLPANDDAPHHELRGEPIRRASARPIGGHHPPRASARQVPNAPVLSSPSRTPFLTYRNNTRTQHQDAGHDEVHLQAPAQGIRRGDEADRRPPHPSVLAVVRGILDAPHVDHRAQISSHEAADGAHRAGERR